MGNYSLPDGRTVSFSDADTIRDVADLWAIIDGEFHNTPSSASEALKTMLGELQAGRPLSDVELSMLKRIQAHYQTQLQKFRQSPDNELEGYLPSFPAGSGRISESLTALRPSLRDELDRRIQESHYKTESTTIKDRNTTAPHLLDTVLHDLAHAKQHADRLEASDVKGNPSSVAFNAEHMLRHLESARDHASRLGQHLQKHPSDPKTFQVEREALHKLRETITPDVKLSGIIGRSIPEPKRAIAVDFDGVIHMGGHGMPGLVEGQPMDGVEKGLKALNEYYKVVIFTARQDFEAVRKWLEDNHLDQYVSEVTNVKPAAAAYIDDRAIHFSNWPDAVKAADPNVATQIKFSHTQISRAKEAGLIK